MLPLYELMMQAQQGEAMKAMARQFQLDDGQMTRAMQALIPAFSTGLKRNTGSPQDIGNFMQALASGQYLHYFENIADAFTPKGTADGNDLLGHLFGSKEVSRAIARQAAQTTGIAQDLLQQMLPVMATTLMGGMFKQSTSGNTGNPFADMIGQMMGQTASGPSATEQDNPFGQMMETMFGGGAASGAVANPYAEMFKTMSRMGFPGLPTAADPAPEDNPNPYDKLFGDMFDAGIKVQKDYQKNMEAIFDDYRRRMRNEP